MKTLLLKALKMIGLKRLLSMVWSSILYPELKKYVQKTESVQWDDSFLDFLDGVIKYIINNKI